MREKLNNDPRTQLIVVAVFGVVFVAILFMTVLKGDPAPTDPAAADPTLAAAPVVPDPAAGSVDPAVTSDPAASAVPASPSTPVPDASAGSADGLLPTKGLPKKLLVAYAKNDAIALTVIDPKGRADKKLAEYTKRLGDRNDVQTFVVPVGKVAKYSRITQGVDVTQTPALVLIRPRDKSTGGPVASVSYGFRSPKSVKIALQDALYDGKTRTVSPK